MPSFPAVKIYSQNYAVEIRGNYHESSDCFTAQNSLLNQKNPSIIPVT